jgi:transcription-repair coupling factor (superfamily II helicase)
MGARVESPSGVPRAAGGGPVDRPEVLAKAVEGIRRRLPPTRGPRALGGVCPSARALALAALVSEPEATVAVVPSERDAEELMAGLELVAPELSTAALPAEAMEAYLGRTPPLGATAVAATALLGLATGEVRVLVVPARLLPYPLPAPPSLPPRCPVLRAKQSIDPHAFAQMLADAGYRRVEVVEEAGDFAIRGQVLDVGTPNRFVRVLLDVDTVEALRAFDPATQRSGEEFEEATVPPLRLFPTDQHSREALAGFFEREGCSAAADAARTASNPSLWEGFLGWALDAVHSWELVPHLVVFEQEAVRTEVERVFAALRLARETLARDEVALPAPDVWLVDPDRCKRALAGADRVEELAIEDGTRWVKLATAPTPNLATRPQALVEELRATLAEGRQLVLVAASTGETQRLLHLLTEAQLPVRQGWPLEGIIGVVLGRLERGFAHPEASLVVFGRADLTTLPAISRQRRSLARVLAEMRDLTAGDFVVHADHGIGRFTGFRTLTLDKEEHECVELEYAGGGKLLVPLERADVLEKYASSEGGPPRLDRLGGTTWLRTKARVKRALKDLAEELLKVQAERQLAPGFVFSKDSPWQREFEEAFEYEPTPDQASAIADAKRDMEAPQAMDRLLVGDVGYGKTEVAMRAAFKAIMDGKQVAVLAPTTILAEQHLRTFSRRFAGFPVEIRWLSRFVPAAEQRRITAGLVEGTVDIVIGTHRLLARDVTFRDLGLLIVDEEQRFGVAQKERLKALRASVDVLAMSATPIPRTLNLGLLGLRDVSIIETPPRDRLAVQTHVLPFRREVLREAILTELSRGGQVFFVHNRVASIGAIAALVSEMVPEARVAVAHGQMDERYLERAMDTFLEGRADVLVATAIIENGLDIPNANTLIVNRADRFGLAQLYQLRGRVGRSDRLAFAYLLVPPERSLTAEARARLAAILEFADLGAGFRIAARDLEIRGAGNLLGAEQHGHLRAVGYETYCRLLEETVRELRGEAAPPPSTAVEMQLGLDLRLPERYISEETLRLAVYRRIAAVHNEEELSSLRQEFTDRFGPAPEQLDHLLLHQRLRRRAEMLGVVRIRRTPSTFELAFDPSHPRAHPTVMALLDAVPGAGLTPTQLLRLPSASRDPVEGARVLAELLPLAE